MKKNTNKKPKNILMVTSFYPPYHVGGACTHVYYLAQELAKKGHTIHILYSKDAYFLKRGNEPSSATKKSYPNHKNIILHSTHSPFGLFTPLLTYITSYIPFNKTIKEIMNKQYDLIHYHNISLFGPRILLYGQGKKIYTAHDHWLITPLNNYYEKTKQSTGRGIKSIFCSLQHKRPPQLWRVGNILKKGLKEIDSIISPSNYLGNCLKRYGVTNKIITLPNLIPEAPKQITLVKPFQHKKNTSFFFFAGMLEPIKGIKELLSIFKKSNQNIIIAGTGSLQKEVEEVSKKYDNIQYVGFLGKNEMYSYYASALSFILPSACEENCPSTIIEAMSVGTPSLSPKRGGSPELLNLIDEGLSYQSEKELQGKIESFSKKEYSKKKVIDVYQKHFSPSGYVKKYLDLFF